MRLSNINLSLSEIERDRLIKPLLDRGGAVHWVSPSEAVAVFASPSVSSAASRLPFRGVGSVKLFSEIAEEQSVEEYDRGLFQPFHLAKLVYENDFSFFFSSLPLSSSGAIQQC